MIEFLDDDNAISSDEKASFTFEVIDKRRNTLCRVTKIIIFESNSQRLPKGTCHFRSCVVSRR